MAALRYLLSRAQLAKWAVVRAWRGKHSDEPLLVHNVASTLTDEANVERLEHEGWCAEQAARRVLESAFEERRPGEYMRRGETTPAFIDSGSEMVVRDSSRETYQAVFLKAKDRGWNPAVLSGTPEQICAGWIEAQLLGVDVANVTPTCEMLAALDARRAEVLALEEARQWELERADAVKHQAEKVDSGRYIGPVIDITDISVLQKVGRDRVVAHPLRNFFEPPRTGDSLDIQYHDGKPARCWAAAEPNLAR